MPEFGLAPQHSWVRPRPKGEWHVADSETRRTVCGTYSEPHDRMGAPDGRLVPENVCEDCREEVPYLYEGEPDYDMVMKFLVPTGPDLRAMRAVLGITQAELAEEVGTTQATISGYENNESQMYSDTLQKIVEVLRRKARAQSD